MITKLMRNQGDLFAEEGYQGQKFQILPPRTTYQPEQRAALYANKYADFAPIDEECM